MKPEPRLPGRSTRGSAQTFSGDYLIYGQRHGSRLAHAAGRSRDGEICRALLDLAVVAASRKSQQDNDRRHHPQPGLQTASPKQAHQQ